MSRRLVAPLLLLIAASSSTCGGDLRVPPPQRFGAGARAPHRGGTLHFTITDDVRTLDPAIAYDEFSNLAEHHVFDTLLTFDEAVEAPDPVALVPQLAESWGMSQDGLTYSFVLREGITFSDGQPVVAEDFVYELERVLAPDSISPGQQFFTGIAGAQAFRDGKAPTISGLVAVDARHLEIHLEKPDASFPLLLAMPFTTPQKKSWVDQVGKRLRDTPLGTGPFTLVEWKQGERMVFARNPRYWNPALPYLDKLVLYLLVPRDVAVLKFLHGESDTVDRLSSDDFLRFAKSDAWKPYLFRVKEMATYGELMNVTKPPFTDKRVRQAMNYALNKDDTVRLYNGRAIPAHGLLPPLMPGFDETLVPYPYDPVKAKQLLTEAGYPNGFDVTYTTTKDELAEKVAQSIQADLAKVGVRVTIRLITFPAYLQAVGKGDLEFAYSAWFMDFPDPWDFLEVKFHSRMISAENSSNDSFYKNPELDALLDRARVELDRDKRLAMYKQAERILYDDCPWVWHYYSIGVEIRQPYVQGYVPHAVWKRSYRTTWLDEPTKGAP